MEVLIIYILDIAQLCKLFKILTQQQVLSSSLLFPAFVPLKELVESLSEETRAQWERLWRTDHHYQVIHPLIYQHPVTGDPVTKLKLE